MWLASKPVKIILAALALVAVLGGVVMYIQKEEREDIRNEEIIRDYETEERVDDAIRNTPSDPDSIREWLHDNFGND